MDRQQGTEATDEAGMRPQEPWSGGSGSTRRGCPTGGSRLGTGLARLGVVLILSLALFVMLRPPAALASDPVGIYSLVEDVNLEADPAAPEQKLRIRVYGFHALSYRPTSGEQRGWGIYTEPAAGYLYFRCPAAELATCALEWQDLMTAVGSDACAAYGQRYLTDPEPNGKLRDPADPVEEPDSYPIGQGILMVKEGERGACAELRAARDRASNAPTPEPVAPPTATTMADPSPEPKPSEAPTQGGPELKPTTAKPGAGTGGRLHLPAIQSAMLAGSAAAVLPPDFQQNAGAASASGEPLSAPRPVTPSQPSRGLLGSSALLVLGAALFVGLRRPPLR